MHFDYVDLRKLFERVDDLEKVKIVKLDIFKTIYIIQEAEIKK